VTMAGEICAPPHATFAVIHARLPSPLPLTRPGFSIANSSLGFVRLYTDMWSFGEALMVGENPGGRHGASSRMFVRHSFRPIEGAWSAAPHERSDGGDAPGQGFGRSGVPVARPAPLRFVRFFSMTSPGPPRLSRPHKRTSMRPEGPPRRVSRRGFARGRHARPRAR
jgi:hypothetical protein